MIPLKSYTVVNRCISGINAGIQAAHSQSELVMKAVKQNLPDDQLLTILEWSKTPTMVILNGGGSFQMRQFLKRVTAGEPLQRFPFATFYEPDMENMLSAITMIVPDSQIACEIKLDGTMPGLDGYSVIEQDILMDLSRMRLAI